MEVTKIALPDISLPEVKTNNTSYVVAVAVMIAIAISAISLIEIFHEGDNSVTITAIIGLLTPTTLSLLAFMKSQETHLSVNSRLDSFIKTSQEVGEARGFKEGRTVGQDEANKRNDALETNKGSNINTEQTVVNTEETLVINKKQ